MALTDEQRTRPRDYATINAIWSALVAGPLATADHGR
jgi:hypothetical protein